jgi:hypothetical protein
LSLLAFAPLGTAPADYVVAQYRDCARKLALSATPDRHFEDLRGLLWRLGWEIPWAWLRALSAVAAVTAAALCLRLRRGLDKRDASLLVYAVAGVYLMLFNARNQANSYVIIAPAAAVPAAVFALRRRWRAAALMAVAVACWCGSAIPLTAYWLKPLTCLVYAIALLKRDLRQPQQAGAGAGSTHHQNQGPF